MAKKEKQAAPPAIAAPALPVIKVAPPRSRFFRPGILIAGLLIGLVGVCLPIVREVLPDLTQREEYRVSAGQFQITPPPRWIPQNLVEQVLHEANLPETFSLLDDGLTRDIGEAFQLHPWVQEVVSVQKSIPATIRVQLVYRKPAAMIQVKQGLYPVDGEGVLLPPADFSISDARQYPLVANVQSTPQGPAGTDWGDPIVTGAARLAQALLPQWKKLQLVAIVCPGEPASSESLEKGLYRLTSVGGSRVVWGLPPGIEHPGELTTEQKLGKLKNYVADFGSLDSPSGGPYEFNIRHWQETGRERLTTELESLETSRQ